jgi:hypothetical protein
LASPSSRIPTRQKFAPIGESELAGDCTLPRLHQVPMISGNQMPRPKHQKGHQVADRPMQRRNKVRELERTHQISREPAPGLEPGTDGYNLILKPGNDPARPSFYRPISLSYTNGKLRTYCLPLSYM